LRWAARDCTMDMDEHLEACGLSSKVGNKVLETGSQRQA
jgi:hypothetical protein